MKVPNFALLVILFSAALASKSPAFELLDLPVRMDSEMAAVGEESEELLTQEDYDIILTYE